MFGGLAAGTEGFHAEVLRVVCGRGFRGVVFCGVDCWAGSLRVSGMAAMSGGRAVVVLSEATWLVPLLIVVICVNYWWCFR